MSRKIRSWFFALLAAFVAAFVAACGPVVDLPGGGVASDYYWIEPVHTAAGPDSRSGIHIIVENPAAPGGLDTDRIALYPEPLALKYFADVRWSERAPVMIRNTLIRSLENSSDQLIVTGRAAGVKSDYRLRLELRDFQAEYTGMNNRPTVRVAFKMMLIRRTPAEIVGDVLIATSATARSRDMRDIIVAFNAASSDAMAEAISWTARTITDDSPQ